MKYLIAFHDFLNESKIEDIYSKYYSDIEIEKFNQIISADPTTILKNGQVAKMGTYSKWLLSLYKVNSLKLEDLYKATDYLTTFDKLKSRKVLSAQQADILSYKSLSELFKSTSVIGGTGKPTEDESYLNEDRYFIINGQAEVYFEDNDYLIVIPRTLEASKFYGKDTQWCTLYPDNFKFYSKLGDLYIIIDKHKLNTSDIKRRRQFHFETSQFMDMNDSKLESEDRKQFFSYFKLHSRNYLLNYDYKGIYHEGRASVRLDGKFGFVDEEGNEVTPLKYDGVGNFREGKAVVKLKGKYGFVDKHGNEVSRLKYNSVGDFFGGMAWVKLKGKFGFVDIQGNEIIPPKYDDVGFFHEGRANVQLNYKYGLVDMQGNMVTLLKYDSIGEFREGRVKFRLDSKYGVLDLHGNEVIAPKYDSVGNFSEGRAVVQLNGKWGCVDLHGNEVIPLKYNAVYDFHEGRARVRNNGKWGFLDVDGNEVIPMKYDNILDDFSNGRATVLLNGKNGSIDLQGNETWD
jgi:hypothetical protein